MVLDTTEGNPRGRVHRQSGGGDYHYGVHPAEHSVSYSIRLAGVPTSLGITGFFQIDSVRCFETERFNGLGSFFELSRVNQDNGFEEEVALSNPFFYGGQTSLSDNYFRQKIPSFLDLSKYKDYKSKDSYMVPLDDLKISMHAKALFKPIMIHAKSDLSEIIEGSKIGDVTQMSIKSIPSEVLTLAEKTGTMFYAEKPNILVSRAELSLYEKLINN
jgi:hypothetical protein